METMTDEAFAEGLARWARTLNGSETYSGAGTFLKAASARLTALARENAALREALAHAKEFDNAVAEFLDADAAWENHECSEQTVVRAQNAMKRAMYAFRDIRKAALSQDKAGAGEG